MSKTRQKTHNELEHLRGEIKKLQTENKALRRRNRQLEKKSHFYDDNKDNDIDDLYQEVEMNRCPNCKKGTLSTLNLKHLIITSCDSCDYKLKVKPNGE